MHIDEFDVCLRGGSVTCASPAGEPSCRTPAVARRAAPCRTRQCQLLACNDSTTLLYRTYPKHTPLPPSSTLCDQGLSSIGRQTEAPTDFRLCCLPGAPTTRQHKYVFTLKGWRICDSFHCYAHPHGLHHAYGSNSTACFHVLNTRKTASDQNWCEERPSVTITQIEPGDRQCVGARLHSNSKLVAACGGTCGCTLNKNGVLRLRRFYEPCVLVAKASRTPDKISTCGYFCRQGCLLSISAYLPGAALPHPSRMSSVGNHLRKIS